MLTNAETRARDLHSSHREALARLTSALPENAETRARDLHSSHREALARLTSALPEQETVTGDQVRALAQAASPTS